MPITLKEVDAFRASVIAAARRIEEASRLYNLALQAIVDQYQMELATGQMSDLWQIREHAGAGWVDETADGDTMSPDMGEMFEALGALDTEASKLGIGPTNLMRFTPTGRPAHP